jgi:hypothetical protein
MQLPKYVKLLFIRQERSQRSPIPGEPIERADPDADHVQPLVALPAASVEEPLEGLAHPAITPNKRGGVVLGQ